jgi:zinc/manganese transport system substrate-binding protein
MRTILSTGTAVGALVALAVLASVLTGGCSTSRSGDGRLRVVAAENFWGDIAAQIAGPGVDVESIVTRPDADPHDYEPTAQDARDFADARLVIENGIGYDPWAQRLLDADAGHDRVVLDVGTLLNVPAGGNPHQWYSRGAVSAYVREVARDLASIDPAHRTAYARRADSFDSTAMAPYDEWVHRIRSQFGGTAIGASESMVSLWAETLGLKLSTPESFVDAVSEGNEPTASDKATVDAQIRRHEIKVFVYNSQNSTPDVQRLVDEAHAARIPVVTITETLSPEHASFQDWQAREAHALYDALAETAR